MKQIFKPVSLTLIAFSLWISWVCASLLHFDDRGNLMVQSYSVWGDWSAHFTFISALRERGLHWITGDNPLFPGIPFQYPFLSHVLTYFFSLVTFTDTIHATYYLSVLCMFVLPFALFTVLKKLGLSPWGALGATLGYLLMGGFQWMDSSLKSTEPLTNQFEQASVFTQFILFEFLPQRAFLFGLLVFLGSAAYALTVKKWSLAKFIGLGLVLSLTSLMHVHTWIAVATLVFFLFLFPYSQKNPSRKTLFLFGLGLASLSGLFLSFLLLRGHGAETRMSWNIWTPGWAQSQDANLKRAQDMNPLVFWIFNTGIFLPLACFGMWIKRKESSLYAVAASGVLLFIVAELFKIQPYYYDNLKLFTYAFLFFTPFVGFALEAIAGVQKIPRCVAVGCAVVLLALQSASGAMDLRSFQNGLQKTQFFSIEEFALVEKFKTLRDSAESVVLINPKHNHWVSCLTGNPVAMGYPGWLWSWGIAYQAREHEIQDVLFGEKAADQVISKLKIRYAVLQTGEQVANRPVNLAYFDEHFKKIASDYGWNIYSLNDRLTSPATSVR